MDSGDGVFLISRALESFRRCWYQSLASPGSLNFREMAWLSSELTCSSRLEQKVSAAMLGDRSTTALSCSSLVTAHSLRLLPKVTTCSGMYAVLLLSSKSLLGTSTPYLWPKIPLFPLFSKFPCLKMDLCSESCLGDPPRVLCSRSRHTSTSWKAWKCSTMTFISTWCSVGVL